MSMDDDFNEPNYANECHYYLPEEFNSTFNNQDSMYSFLHVNVRSLSKNFDSLDSILSTLSHSFSVIGVTETWLHNYSPPVFKLKTYSLIRADRKTGKGGGVALYVDSSIPFKLRHDLCLAEGSAESLFIEMECDNSKNRIIGVIYRPPACNLETFFVELENLTSKLGHENKFTHILGDFNIDLLSLDINCRRFQNILYANAHDTVINKPTRIMMQSSTLIDNIITNVNKQNVSSGILYSDISDHLPIFSLFSRSQCNQTLSRERNSLVRIYTPEKIQRLNLDLSTEEWGDVLMLQSVEEAYKLFMTKLHYFLDRNVPKTTAMKKSSRKYIKKPWVTRAILKSIKKRNILYKASIRNPTITNVQKYKTYRNRLTSVLRESKKVFFLK